uniref:T-complex protein 1 subunit eta n=1 Tax=Myxobolus squamalis TaxID=59785 RepID=A0A6B2G329_MYXSQ
MSQSMMMKPGIILLKEGTDDSQGVNQILSNITACVCVADAIKTTLGPKGMDKIIVDENGKTTVSNDGATIIAQIDIVHPAAQTLAAIARSQDSEIGDGTTSVVVIAAELMKVARSFIEDGVYPGLIAKSYSKAAELCVEKIKSVAIATSSEDENTLINCAATSMNSKLIAPYKEIFAPMVVDAVRHIDKHMPLDMIGIKKVSGGTIQDSKLVMGVAFKKTFSYAGFEMQPKMYQKPKIALLNVELELKAERDNAEIRIQEVEEYQRIVDAEWKILYDKLDKVVNSGAKIVLSKLPIGDVATQYFADRDIFCAGRVPEEDLKRAMCACGGTIRTVLDELNEVDLGTCETFEEVQVGNERYNIFCGGKKSKTCTFLLRGCGEQFLEEIDRSLHDSIMVVKRVIEYGAVVAGGGAVEMLLSFYLREYSFTLKGKDQLLIAAYARALEVIPRQLCQNAGIDPALILNALRPRHASGQIWCGVDLDNDTVRDNFEACVWEPSVIKINAIIAATEAACTILTVDETIKHASRNQNIQQ